MTARDALIKVIRGEEKTHIPFDFEIAAYARDNYLDKMQGQKENDYFGNPVDRIRPNLMAAKQDADFSKYYTEGLPENTFIDEWGIATFIRNGLTFHVHPMKDMEEPEELADYPFPDFSRKECYEHMRAQADEIKSKGKLAIAAAEKFIFAIGRDIRGYEQHLMDYYMNEEFNEALLDKAMELQKQLVAGMATSGVDMLWLSSDVASQDNVFIEPGKYSATVAWRMKEVFKAAKDANPDILIAYHCCGNVLPILHEFLDFGIDILHPIQPESLNLHEIKERTKGRLTLWGGLSVQQTFPYGTPEDVRAEVRNACKILGEGGQYVVAPSNTLTEDTPWENIVAFVDEAKKMWPY